MKKKHGFSLIELMIVISITTILLITVFLIYEQIRDHYLLDQEVNAAITMSSEIKSFNPEGASYSKIDNYFLNDLKLFPPGFKVNPARFNSLDGTFSILGAEFIVHDADVYTSEDTNSHTPGDSSAFYFIYSGIPEKFCLPFVNGVSSYAARIEVDTQTLKDSIPEQAGNVAGTQSSNSVKYTFENAKKLCSSSSSVKMIVLTFF